MNRLRTLPGAFLVLVAVFVVTHVLRFPGSLAYCARWASRVLANPSEPRAPQHGSRSS